MKTIIHRAKSRGHFDHGWLDTYHTFSFAEYFDPQRVHFGALRVLNDDTVSAGQGFGMHSHHDMEIISIPLKGALEHQDSLGNKRIIPQGTIQIMSAGTGVRHSEYNKNSDKPVQFLQIWVLPNKRDVKPRYAEAKIDNLIPDQLNEIVTPYPGNGNQLWIYQDAWFSIGELSTGTEITYTLKGKESYGVYIFVIEGEIIIDEDIELLQRDGMGQIGNDPIQIKALTKAEVLLIEVPSLK